jgi:hypothetical protein
LGSVHLNLSERIEMLDREVRAANDFHIPNACCL